MCGELLSQIYFELQNRFASEFSSRKPYPFIYIIFNVTKENHLFFP